MPLLLQSDRFNYLVKMETEEPTKVGYSMYRCILCDTVKELKDCHVRTNATISCGCAARMVNFREDLTGKVFNSTQVIGYEGNSTWRVIRGCGCVQTMKSSSLKICPDKCIDCSKGKMRDLLIKRNFKHGKAKSKTHTCWLQMKRRCKGLTNRAEFYKDKGISYPEEWEDFPNFISDMGECPDNYSLERLDVSKSYSKDNCIWADNKTQANNKTNNILITNGKEVMSLKHWCDSLGLEYRTQFARFRYGGKSIEQILGDEYRLAKDKFDI